MPDPLVIKKEKVWWYTFSEGSAPLSFSDKLNKGRYQSCRGLSGVVGTKKIINQSCIYVNVDVNNINGTVDPTDQPTQKQVWSS